jgi:O-antigen/teichoic acid export membrane protein
MKDLVHSSLLVATARVVGIALQGLTVLFLARTLPVEKMGYYALFFAALGFARMLGPLGTDQVAMRRTAMTENNRHDKALHGFLNTGFALVVAINSLVALSIVIASVFARSWILHKTGLSLFDIVVFAAAIPAYAAIGLLTAQLRGFDLKVLAQVPDSVLLQLVFGSGLVLCHAHGGIHLASVLLWQTISAWVVVAVYLLILVKIGIDFTARVSRDAARALVKEGRQVAFALAVTALSVRAPIFISAPLLGSAATAVLDVASRFGTLPTITTQSVAVTFAPRFASLVHSDDRRTLSRALSISSILSAAPALACLLVIGFGAPPVIRAVLPPVYSHAYLPMMAVCFASAVNAAFGGASTLLFMAQRSNVVRNYTCAQFLAICLFSALLGRAFGPLGMALAMVAGSIVRDFGLALWVSREFGIRVPPSDWRRNVQIPVPEIGAVRL